MGVNINSTKHPIMSKKIDSKDFIKAYCQTLDRNERGCFYLKIPLENYEELSLFRIAMVNAIEFTAGLDRAELQERSPLTIHYLSHILQNIDFFTECQGLTTLFDPT